jgi:hypothetical protein
MISHVLSYFFIMSVRALPPLRRRGDLSPREMRGEVKSIHYPALSSRFKISSS